MNHPDETEPVDTAPMDDVYISLASWLTETEVKQQRAVSDGPVHATIHIVIPHGKGRRHIEVPVTMNQCLALAANAADAARMLATMKRGESQL